MGFLSDAAWSKQRQPLALVPECGVCGLYKKCKSPKMPVDGQGRRKTLIVAEGPGHFEDIAGRPLVGNAGAEQARLLFKFGVDMRRDCWLTNAIICRATDERGQNRPPDNKEIDHCRPNVIRAIEELQPEIIIPLGLPAVQSVLGYAWKNDLGEYGSMEKWAGWQIPCRKLNAWICPTYHSSFLLRVKEQNKAAEVVITEHLRQAFAHKGRPHKEIVDYRKQVKIEMDHRKAATMIRAMNTGRPVAFDIETDRLKPDSQDSKILCCAVSDGIITVAFPWFGEVIPAMREFIKNPDIPKVAANLDFEERWCWRHLGCGVRNWHWDTLLGAHWLNCHGGIVGLKFQAFVLLGMEDYSSHLEALMESDTSNTPNRLHTVDKRELLTYCGTDAILEILVAQKQMESYGGSRL